MVIVLCRVVVTAVLCHVAFLREINWESQRGGVGEDDCDDDDDENL